MNVAWKIIRGILIAVGILALICILVVSCSVSVVDELLEGSGAGSVVLEENRNYDFTGEITALELKLGAAEVTIRQGEGFSVETNGKYIVCESRNGVLTVRESDDRPLFRRNQVTVSITIPAGKVFRHVDLESGACQLVVQELCCETLELEMGAGELVAEHLEVTGSAEIQGGAGRLSIHRGELRNLELDMGIGELELQARLLGTCSIDMGTGSANLELIGPREDYRITMDTGIGSAKLENETMQDGTVYGSGENRIRIDGGIGDITIRFAIQE